MWHTPRTTPGMKRNTTPAPTPNYTATDDRRREARGMRGMAQQEREAVKEWLTAEDVKHMP